MLQTYLKYWKPMFALPRPIWILAWATLVNRIGTMVVPFLALYVTQGLHFSTEQAGFLVGTYGVGSLLMSPVIGHLCDRFGTLEIMVASLVSGAAVMLCFPFVSSYAAVLVLAFLLAVTSEGFRPAAMTAIAEFTEGPDRKPAFALVRLAINLGMAVGPALGAVLFKVSVASLFYVDGITCLLAAIVLGPSLKRRAAALAAAAAENPCSATLADTAPATSFLQALRDRRLAYFLLAIFPASVVFFQHESTMPLFMVQDLRLDEIWFGWCFTLNCVIIIFSEIPLVLATNHWSPRFSMALGSALYGIGFGLLSVVTNGPGVIFTVVLWTFGEMFLFPAATTYVSEIAPACRRGLYMGMYTMGFSVAFIVAPLLGTQLMQRFGGGVLWASCFALGLASVLLFLRLDGARPAAEAAPNSRPAET